MITSLPNYYYYHSLVISSLVLFLYAQRFNVLLHDRFYSGPKQALARDRKQQSKKRRNMSSHSANLASMDLWKMLPKGVNLTWNRRAKKIHVDVDEKEQDDNMSESGSIDIAFGGGPTSPKAVANLEYQVVFKVSGPKEASDTFLLKVKETLRHCYPFQVPMQVEPHIWRALARKRSQIEDEINARCKPYEKLTIKKAKTASAEGLVRIAVCCPDRERIQRALLSLSDTVNGLESTHVSHKLSLRQIQKDRLYAVLQDYDGDAFGFFKHLKEPNSSGNGNRRQSPGPSNRRTNTPNSPNRSRNARGGHGGSGRVSDDWHERPLDEVNVQLDLYGSDAKVYIVCIFISEST